MDLHTAGHSRGVVAGLIFKTGEQIQTVWMPWILLQEISIAFRCVGEIPGTMVI